MTPPYNKWKARQAEAVRLYRELWWDVHTISWWLEVAPTTVYRYLRLANIPRRNFARTVAPVSKRKRPPYWRLHTRDGSSEVECGRKFCAGCGHWREVCDFPRDATKGYRVPLARCRACVNITRKWYDRHLSPEQLADRRERHRIFYAGRRNTGQRNGNGHPNVTDKIEWAFLPAEPLALLLDDVGEDFYEHIARRVGVSDRTLNRYLNGESEYVRLDIADKLALALGSTLWDVYGDTPIIHHLATLGQEVPV